ncbi:alanine racemase domain protein [Beutenbergia cavernae DSM 12333]|uniref:Alanine racemase domain protein n=1 Tax=Beutenbergia cavernae (strain ATCC BAA-8 / DSM 12333 / CCUG 43141 / JCM 11478 / NBRC 16432 / NCIMB 13614 / HKI 0122) TaxID=471853 RepID=C5BUY3_BEUC1|nr:alanine racemase [Beutenbergia cavernae]ACQ78357.1 alanine racemase domain protein [Beutenbergia cavernae DSM 12333]
MAHASSSDALGTTPPRLGPEHKSFPPRAWGRTAAGAGLRLRDLATPVLTLDAAALEHNLATLAAWCAEHGVDLAPHGKTTMAPQLWHRQLDAGAWAITVATPWQAQVARAAGVPRILLANALVDPAGIAWAAFAVADDAGPTELLSWVDGVDGVARLEDALASHGAPVPLDVLVELGTARTGARGVDAALAVAAAVRRSPHLRLAGVAGYEGAAAHDRSDEAVAAVRAYVADVVALHDAVDGSYEVPTPVLTLGGSAFPDLVVDGVAGLRDGVRVVLRSGAYVLHDDGFYASVTPFGRGAAGGDVPLRSAMHAWARVVSRPERGLALLDAGKRDVPYDEGLPTPQLVAGAGVVGRAALAGAHVSALNDQHAFLRLPRDDAWGAADDPLGVGAVVRLGLSHPCTAMDKWRLVPVVVGSADEDPDLDAPVTDAVATYF